MSPSPSAKVLFKGRKWNKIKQSYIKKKKPFTISKYCTKVVSSSIRRSGSSPIITIQIAIHKKKEVRKQRKKERKKRKKERSGVSLFMPCLFVCCTTIVPISDSVVGSFGGLDQQVIQPKESESLV